MLQILFDDLAPFVEGQGAADAVAVVCFGGCHRIGAINGRDDGTECRMEVAVPLEVVVADHLLRRGDVLVALRDDCFDLFIGRVRVWQRCAIFFESEVVLDDDGFAVFHNDGAFFVALRALDFFESIKDFVRLPGGEFGFGLDLGSDAGVLFFAEFETFAVKLKALLLEGVLRLPFS